MNAQKIDPFVNHVIHGDCVNVMQGMPSGSVDFVCTDPPYLVKYRPRDGRKCQNDDNADWLKPAFREIARLMKLNSFCATFYGWPWVDDFMAAWKTCGLRPVSHLTWVKTHVSRQGYTRSFHEVGFLLAKGRPPLPGNPPPDVLPWQYTGNDFHPNQKPVVGLVPLINAYCPRGGIVLDPFSGSGTTGLAATACAVRFILIEKDRNLAETARRRNAL